MNKVSLSLFLLLLYLNLFGQDTTRQLFSKEAYLKKSKAQKIAGWILLGGGVGMMAGSAATYQAEPYINLFPEQPLTTENIDNSLSTFLAVGGVAAAVGGAICLASSSLNKKRAASISMSNQQLFLPWQKPLTTRTQPAMTLRIVIQ